MEFPGGELRSPTLEEVLRHTVDAEWSERHRNSACLSKGRWPQYRDFKICSNPGDGLHLEICEWDGRTLLSRGEGPLDEVVKAEDGRDWTVPRGLFIPRDLARRGIEAYYQGCQASPEIEWIQPDTLPPAWRGRLKRVTGECISQAVAKLRTELSHEHFYAFIILPVDGFCGGACLTACSREGLARVRHRLRRQFPDHQEQGEVEVLACEWAFEVVDFRDIDEPVIQVFTEFNDLEIYSGAESEMIEGMILELLLELKAEGMFSGPPFEEDVLLGVQYLDQVGEEYVREVSAKLNSPQWHEKISRFYGQVRN